MNAVYCMYHLPSTHCTVSVPSLFRKNVHLPFSQARVVSLSSKIGHVLSAVGLGLGPQPLT